MAKSVGLKTIIYTGYEFKQDIIQQLVKSNMFDYIKCGQYIEQLSTINHIEYGVVLATSNQHIYKKGKDY